MSYPVTSLPVAANGPASHQRRYAETIIVGAGIAGLACARRLYETGHRFLLISENVGGRIQRSGDGTANLGAYYVRADYTHVNRYVHLGRRIDRLAIHRHDRDGAYTYWNRRLLLRLPQATRFLRHLTAFRRRYHVLKGRTISIGQAEAIRSDPVLFALYQQPAADFVEQHRLNELAHWYLAPGLHGTTFASLHDITAFTLLLGALPALVPTYEFTPRFDLLIDGFTDAIVADAVTAITPHGTGYQIETTANGTLTTRRLVIATPPDIATKLVGFGGAKRPVSAHMFHIAGSLRAPYDRAAIHLFPESDPTLAVSRLEGGTVLFGSRYRHPHLDRYFSQWEVLEHKHWNPAFHLLGNSLVEAEPAPNLYLAGDHNMVGLEDAYLTGLHAANRIITAPASPDCAPQQLAPVASRHYAAASSDSG
jgi:glycine/D-amino acid oxidase-like deaminating enzyme